MRAPLLGAMVLKAGVLKASVLGAAILRAAVGCVLIAPSLWAADLLSQGNAAFRSNDFEEAVRLYESEDESSDDRAADRLTRRFNAGVSWLRRGKFDEALERFEDVSVRARGELQATALFNAGGIQFEKGKALVQEDPAQADGAQNSGAPAAPEGSENPTDARIARLGEAVKAYQAALEFYRRIEWDNAESLYATDTPYNITVTKTALRAALDEIARLQEEKERQEEEEALKSPAKLLAALTQREKLHRAASRALADSAGQKVRLSSRRLRKSETKNRTLAEKLLHTLEVEPAAGGSTPSGQQPNEPQPSDEEKARQEHAATALRSAIEGMKNAEVSYGKLELGEAVGHHTVAITHLRAAREAFPLELPQLVAEGLSAQETVLERVQALKAETGSTDEEGKTGGLGHLLVDTLKDKVLQPIAKLFDPQRRAVLEAQADEEEEVVWSSALISRAELPPPAEPEAPPNGAPTVPHPHQPGPQPPGAQPQLSAAETEALNAALKKEGTIAHQAAKKAKATLLADDLDGATQAGEEAAAALKRIEELLPKPPEPLEARLRRLIEKQRGAHDAAGGLGSLEAEARAQASAQLEDGQRVDGKTAGGIAAELEKRGDDPARRAAPKVREGEGQIFASAEALQRERGEEATVAIERDIALLEEALAILSGQDKQENQEQGQQDQQQQQQQQGQDQQGSDEERRQSAYAMTPEQARREKEKQNRKRREEEAKIFAGSSSITVEKDW